MSFLNPVNEPVLRFSSTDAGAPQINYNARTAGDIKAVLKACLVTGYGSIASAGWSVTNEVAHVVEFISPSVAMSDYRLKVDDSSTGNTIWSYFYQNSAIAIPKGSVSKSFSAMNKTSSSNGWQLLVAKRGLLFIEILVNPYNNKRMARVTYWGPIKSALITDIGSNMGFWQVGVSSSANFPNDFYRVNTESYYNIDGVKTTTFSAANISILSNNNASYGATSVDISSELYISADANLLGKQPGLLVKTVALEDSLYGVYDEELGGRPMLKVCIGRNDSRGQFLVQYCSVMCLYLDYWEY